jgi:NLI interacting factor-like phosphatase
VKRTASANPSSSYAALGVAKLWTDRLPQGTPAPAAILLDMDGTMIGRIMPSVCEYDIIKQFEPAKLGAFRKQLASRLRYGPVRPFLANFCKRAKAMGTELFVYTASDDKWANCIVPCIESCIGVKFARPIFARSQCVQAGPSGEFKKSVERVLPIMYRRLRPRLGPMSINEFRTRTMLLDNNPAVLQHGSEASRLVICPTYEYMYAYDVLASLGIDLIHARFHRIASLLKKHDMFPDHVDPSRLTFQQFMVVYTKHLSEVLQATYRANQAALKHDRLFVTMQEHWLRSTS